MHTHTHTNTHARTHACTHAPEGDYFWNPEAQALFKAHIEVNVHELAAGGVQQDVVQVPVHSQAHFVDEVTAYMQAYSCACPDISTGACSQPSTL
eukprot:1156723-Pelagomonas_calceolata.AAC.22